MPWQTVSIPADSIHAAAGIRADHAVCLIPMRLPTPSVGPQIAECQRVLEKSGLEYKVSFVVQMRVSSHEYELTRQLQ